MKRLGIHSCCFALLIGLSTCPAPAADFDAQQIADAIGPFVDAETVIVAHIDLARIEVDATVKWISRFVSTTDAEPNDVEQNATMATMFAKQFRDQLKEAGATQIFVTATLRDISQQQYNVIVPVAEGGDHRQVGSLFFCAQPDGPTSLQEANDANLPPGNFEVCQRVGDVVFCGPAATMKRLPHAPNERVDAKQLATGFQQAGDSDGQLLVLPADPFRVLREMDPDLPEQLGGISGKDVADGIRWAALGVNGPPETSLRLTLQSSDERAARILRAAIDNGLDWLAERPEVKQSIPDMSELKPVPTQAGNRLIVSVEEASLESVVDRIVASTSTPLMFRARQTERMKRLKMLALAMWNFESTYGGFAPPAGYSDEGKPLLSWRVYLLPFLEEVDLYRRFRLDEPWDSPHNRKLIREMPDVFLSRGMAGAREGKTGFVVPNAEGTAFHGKDGTSARDIKDGTSKTIMIAEAAPEHAVIWTKPGDWNVNFTKPTEGLVSADDTEVMFAFCDGSVSVFPVTIDADRLRLLVLMADGQPVER